MTAATAAVMRAPPTKPPTTLPPTDAVYSRCEEVSPSVHSHLHGREPPLMGKTINGLELPKAYFFSLLQLYTSVTNSLKYHNNTKQ